jgi:hypothetical protein
MGASEEVGFSGHSSLPFRATTARKKGKAMGKAFAAECRGPGTHETRFAEQ